MRRNGLLDWLCAGVHDWTLDRPAGPEPSYTEGLSAEIL